MPQGYGNAIQRDLFSFLFLPHVTSSILGQQYPNRPPCDIAAYAESGGFNPSPGTEESASQACCHSVSTTVALTEFLCAQGWVRAHKLCHPKLGHGNLS